MVSNSEFERRVRDQFEEGQKFIYKEEQYQVIVAGKPRPSSGRGECKTDCYVKLKNISTSQERELKISCKLININDFQENKIKASRAEQIFGPNWQDIIQGKSEEIRDKFLSTGLNYPEGKGRTKEGHLILGWKLEISSEKNPRTLSRPLDLSYNQIRESIYKGVDQDQGKVDSKVNGIIVAGSGVANYMLEANLEDIQSPGDVLDRLVNIDEFPIKPHHMIFTSNAYRINSGETDGNRPLAVRVVWKSPSQKLSSPYDLIPKIEFHDPLGVKSNSNTMRENVDLIFNEFPELNIKYKKK